MIVLDIDDVLANYMVGVVLKYGPPKAWMGRMPKMYPELDLVKHFADMSFVEDLPIVDGALSGTHWLVRNRYNIYYATARPRDKYLVTYAWLNQNRFPVPERTPRCLGLICTEGRANKIEWLRERRDQVDLIIDDDPWTIYEAGIMGVRGFLFDRPWNRTTGLHEKSQRVLGWTHILMALWKEQHESKRAA